jgi:hypothetical protein
VSRNRERTSTASRATAFAALQAYSSDWRHSYVLDGAFICIGDFFFPVREIVSIPGPALTLRRIAATKGNDMISNRIQARNDHVKIVVNEGRVTMEDLHKALDLAVKQMVPKGGCNCGLTGFDLTFLRGDPEISKVLIEVPNIQGAILDKQFNNTVGN